MPSTDRSTPTIREGAPSFDVVNPATEAFDHTVDGHDGKEVGRRLARAGEAFTSWRSTSFAERAGVLEATAEKLRHNQGALALLMTKEMGKPIVQAEAEVEKCAWACDHYAEHGEAYLASEPIETDASESFVRFDPLGAIFAIMPWNFPLWQVFRFAAPNLMAGNVGLLKHAPNVPGCALAIEETLRQAGVPEGVFQTLLIDESSAAGVISHPAVRAVTLTGSVGAGAAVAAEAGRWIKKTVLELGGSDPFVVLPDVDVEAVAERAVQGRTLNSGQSCIAAKRFIVHADVHDAFVEALVEGMNALVVGDPNDRDTDVGPLARKDLRDQLHDQVRASVEAGATMATGGEAGPSPGWYYRPTVLTDIQPGSPAFDEELFGPVASVFEARSVDHAVELANGTRFGLGASIWGADEDAARALVPRIEAGCVFVNHLVQSDPRVPFGGIGHSGYGRELARQGIREFVNHKTVWIGG